MEEAWLRSHFTGPRQSRCPLVTRARNILAARLCLAPECSWNKCQSDPGLTPHIPHSFIRCLLCGPGAGNTEMIKTLWFLPSRATVFYQGDRRYMTASQRDMNPWGRNTVRRKHSFFLKWLSAHQQLFHTLLDRDRKQTLWGRRTWEEGVKWWLSQVLLSISL